MKWWIPWILIGLGLVVGGRLARWLGARNYLFLMLRERGLVPKRWESNAARRKRLVGGKYGLADCNGTVSSHPSLDDVREFAAELLRVKPSRVNVAVVGPCHIEIVIPAVPVGIVGWLQGRLSEEMPAHLLFTITRTNDDQPTALKN